MNTRPDIQAGAIADPQAIRSVTQSRDHSFATAWYDEGGPENFWMQWRARVFESLLRRYQVPLHSNLRMLDIGGGRGVLRSQLEAFTAWTIDVAELDSDALAKCPSGRGSLNYYDILERNPDFLGAYDGGMLFDIIEHVPDPRAFAEAAVDHLKPGGWLFVNVPAINGLRSSYDDAVGHLRRYDRQGLHCDLSGAGLEVLGVHYWGLSMVPLLALRRMILGGHLGGGDAAAVIDRGWKPPGPLVASVLRMLMKLETTICPTAAYGTSLMAICRKPA
jgi:SAM-dependent methyltransferase